MDFDSPDVMKDFPGLYASELNKQCDNESDYSDENERVLKKDILIGKRKDKKDKEKGYAALEGESSADENYKSRSPSKSKKAKPFKFTSKVKEKRDKSREKDKEADKKNRDKKTDKKNEKDKTKSDKTKKNKQSFEEAADIGEILPIFGANLDLAIERSRCHDGIELPLPVRATIDRVEEIGINYENLYKVSGPKSKVFHIRKLYNQRATVDLSEFDIPTVTSLLKTFLRDLPEPIFTIDHLIRFEEAGAILNLNTREKHLKILIDNLPASNRLLLAWLITHLHNVSLNEKTNKMNKQSLSAALNHTFHCSSRLLHALLHHCQALFPSTLIAKYVPPLGSGERLPEEPDLIEVELRKQESLLAQIHQEMHNGCVCAHREELLWEVQRIITQLKRRLKTAHKDKESSAEARPDRDVEVAQEAAEVEEPTQKRQISEGEEDAVDRCEEAAEAEVVIEGSGIDYGLKSVKLKNEGLHQLRETLLKHILAEKEEIAALKSKLEGCSQNQTVPPVIKDIDEVMDLYVKENQILEIKKINLVRQIIEEQEMCIELKTQIILNTMTT